MVVGFTESVVLLIVVCVFKWVVLPGVYRLIVLSIVLGTWVVLSPLCDSVIAIWLSGDAV